VTEEDFENLVAPRWGFLRTRVGAEAWDQWAKHSMVDQDCAKVLLSGINPGDPNHIASRSITPELDARLKDIGRDGKPRSLYQWLRDALRVEHVCTDDDFDAPDSSTGKGRDERAQTLLAKAARVPDDANVVASATVDRLYAVRAKIAEWMAVGIATATDKKYQEDALALLRAEELSLNSSVERLRGDHVDSDATEVGTDEGALNVDPDPRSNEEWATPEQLIAAFGSFTGMDASWFKKLADSPALLRARRREGQGGRKLAAPLFDPYEVMRWLIDEKRRKGNSLAALTGWRRLKACFPASYRRVEALDPTQD